jgi:hypothetical protein
MRNLYQIPSNISKWSAVNMYLWTMVCRFTTMHLLILPSLLFLTIKKFRLCHYIIHSSYTAEHKVVLEICKMSYFKTTNIFNNNTITGTDSNLHCFKIQSSQSEMVFTILIMLTAKVKLNVSLYLEDGVSMFLQKIPPTRTDDVIIQSTRTQQHETRLQLWS